MLKVLVLFVALICCQSIEGKEWEECVESLENMVKEYEVNLTQIASFKADKKEPGQVKMQDSQVKVIKGLLDGTKGILGGLGDVLEGVGTLLWSVLSGLIGGLWNALTGQTMSQPINLLYKMFKQVNEPMIKANVKVLELLKKTLDMTGKNL